MPRKRLPALPGLFEYGLTLTRYSGLIGSDPQLSPRARMPNKPHIVDIKDFGPGGFKWVTLRRLQVRLSFLMWMQKLQARHSCYENLNLLCVMQYVDQEGR